MPWLKSNLWKAGITIAGVLLLLTSLIVVFALLEAGQQTVPSGRATGTGVTQATPTVDATAVAGDILKTAG